MAIANDEYDQQFCLRWKTFPSSLSSQFKTLRDNEDFVDVTIACAGSLLGAHKLVLSACSPYFKNIFKSNPCQHPVLLMLDVEAKQMHSLLQFVYCGEVDIARNDLPQFLKIAEHLQVRGLAERNKESADKVAKSKSNSMLENTIPQNENSKPKISENNVSTCEDTVDIPVEKIIHNSKQNVDAISINSSQNANRENIELCYNNIAGLMAPKIEYDNNDEVMTIEGECMTNFISNSMPASSLNSKPHSGDVDYPCFLDTIQGCEEYSYQKQKNTYDNLQDTNEFVRNQVTNQTQQFQGSLNTCHICGRAYSNRSNLKQHINLIHSPEEMACPICQKTFRTKLYLRRHVASYHGEKIVFSPTSGFDRGAVMVQNGGLVPSVNTSISEMKKISQNIGVELVSHDGAIG